MIEKAPQNIFTKTFAIILVVLAFVAMYQPWNLHLRELRDIEGFFATNMLEFNQNNYPITTAHGVNVINGFFLFPYISQLLKETFHLSIENALRFQSLFWLGATALLAGITAGLIRSFKAGIVSACVFFGIHLIFQKSEFGFPVSMGVFFVLAAHISWIYFGFIKSNWNLAWIISLILVSIGFLGAGFSVLIYFFLPLLFTHRPIKGVNKMSKWGFLIGFFILIITILLWAFPYLISTNENMFDYSIFYIKDGLEVLLDIVYTPFEMIIRLLPWTLIAWMPFCIALRGLDETPIISHYFRVLFFTNYIFALLNPFSKIIGTMYAISSLAILCGLSYDVGVRCYSRQMRKLIILCSYACIGLAIITVVYCFMPNSYFKNSLPTFSLAILFLLQAFWVYYYRKNGQIWLILLSVSVSLGLFFYGTMNHYRTDNNIRREIGGKINSVLIEDGAKSNIDKLYKVNISGFYNEGAYVGFPIQKINSLSDMNPTEAKVYLLSVDFPQFPSRNWTNLLRGDYREQKLTVWRGDLIETPELHNPDFKSLYENEKKDKVENREK